MSTLKILLIAGLVGAAFAIGWMFATDRKAPVVVVLPRPGGVPKAQAAAGGPAPQVPGASKQPAAAVAVDEAGQTLAAALDVFTSRQSTLAQKQAVLEQLRKGGRLDEAIATLKQMAAQNPGDASIPTALGEALIAQIRNLYENGASPMSNDVAILGLQADQNFTAALALDPTNWEAQFDKAASMSHWPAALNKGPEVIDRLTALVAQQAATTPQPEFAQTYALLGEQYVAAGQPDKAAQIWQQGLGLFPLSSTLQREVTPQPAH